MEAFNAWLGVYEPLWLFLLISAELLVGICTLVILIVEYRYDASFNEQLKAARRESRRKKYDFNILNDGEGK